jgi:hypothetical protein
MRSADDSRHRPHSLRCDAYRRLGSAAVPVALLVTDDELLERVSARARVRSGSGRERACGRADRAGLRARREPRDAL